MPVHDESLDARAAADGRAAALQCRWAAVLAERSAQVPPAAEGLGTDEESARGALDVMKDMAVSGMPETLAALKAEAERA